MIVPAESPSFKLDQILLSFGRGGCTTLAGVVHRRRRGGEGTFAPERRAVVKSPLPSKPSQGFCGRAAFLSEPMPCFACVVVPAMPAAVSMAFHSVWLLYRISW